MLIENNTISDLKKRTEQVASWCISSCYQDINDEQIINFLNVVENWQPLLERIEYHGLSPAFYDIIKPHRELMGKHTMRIVKGLSVKHQIRWKNHLIALKELQQSFEQADIPFVLIKGAAIANQIYICPWHRCMEDIDILIPASQAKTAQRIMKKRGYNSPGNHPNHLMDHHHLPAAQKIINHQNVVVELHTQALSTDMFTPIYFGNLNAPLANIEFAGLKWGVLGHIDTLRLLCLHTFTRDAVIKLSGIVDILRYATCYVDEIEWQRIDKSYGFIINTLRLCQCIVDLPPQLHKIVKPVSENFKQNIKGIGYGMTPLRELSYSNIQLTKRINNLLSPSPWWMHIFYDVMPEKTLFSARWIKHPLTVAFWLAKKQWLRIVSRFSKP